jgi:hypothetical protein
MRPFDRKSKANMSYVWCSCGELSLKNMSDSKIAIGSIHQDTPFMSIEPGEEFVCDCPTIDDMSKFWAKRII